MILDFRHTEFPIPDSQFPGAETRVLVLLFGVAAMLRPLQEVELGRAERMLRSPPLLSLIHI